MLLCGVLLYVSRNYYFFPCGLGATSCKMEACTKSQHFRAGLQCNVRVGKLSMCYLIKANPLLAITCPLGES